MKFNHYIVTFTTGKTCFCTAFTEEEAVILAKAVMIKNGLIYDVMSITKTNISEMKNADYTD